MRKSEKNKKNETGVFLNGVRLFFMKEQLKLNYLERLLLFKMCCYGVKRVIYVICIRVKILISAIIIDEIKTLIGYRKSKEYNKQYGKQKL